MSTKQQIERMEAQAAELRAAREELYRRANSVGFTREAIEVFSKTCMTPTDKDFSEGLPQEVKDKILKAVTSWVFQYVAETLEGEGPSRHLKDAAREYMLEAVLGNDIYQILNVL